MNVENTLFLTAILYAVAFGISVHALSFLSVGLGAKRQKWPWHQVSLIVFFGAEAIDFFIGMLEASPFVESFAQLAGWNFPFYPLLPISLWFYVRSLTEVSFAPVKKDLVHLIPFGLSFFILAPVLILPADHRLAVLNEDDLPVHLMASFVIFTLMWTGLIAVYAVKIVRRLVGHHKRLRSLFSSRQYDLTWMNIFIGLLIAIGGFSVADQLIAMGTGSYLLNDIADTVFEIGIVSTVAIFGLQTPKLLPAWLEETAPSPHPDEKANATSPPGPKAYARSGLTDADCERLLNRLDMLMGEKAPWRNPLLTLKDLASETAIKAPHITQSLNVCAKKNFYEYVNSWRIDEAKRLLTQSKNTIISISEEVGFNSKSTFNAAFKKETGLTPSEYRKQNIPAAPQKTD